MMGPSRFLVTAASCFFISAVVAQPPGFLPAVQVHLKPGTDRSNARDEILSRQPMVAGMKKMFSLSDEELIKLFTVQEGLPDLTRWYIIDLVEGADAELFMSQLKSQENVDVADFMPDLPPQPTILRHLQATPDFEPFQGYLNAAPEGIDARFIWTIPGGDGSGVKVYDVEREWTQNHEDLAPAAGVIPLVGPGLTGFTDDPNHGTAVLGELVGTGNSMGVTGISPAALVGLAEEWVWDGGNLRRVIADAIILAVQDGLPGDVILLEAQTSVCGLGGCDAETQDNCGPVEWDQAVFDAIQIATANGFTVVEAAGNGNVDLDQAGCLGAFDRTVRDSGAIIIGAGAPGTAVNARSKLDFSSFGSRVDVQGWGSNIFTTGYGDQFTDPDPANVNRHYTQSFGGTSGASPIAAGAAVNLQGVAVALFGTPLTPFQLRELMVDTGTPQTGDLTTNIGPLPNLQAAYSHLTPEGYY